MIIDFIYCFKVTDFLLKTIPEAIFLDGKKI